jgi:hypothetical protein
VPLEIDGIGGLHGAVRKTLGIRGSVRHCAAVLFDRGGDDGYWMRTLPFKNFKYRRCGLLVVTQDGVAYAELCMTFPKPSSGIGFAARLAVRGKGSFAYYTWAARKGEISDVSVQHVQHSPYGGYASITITANGQRMRFGLSEGEPSVLGCISAIRYLAGASLSLPAAAPRPPRTDGIYVIGAEQLLRPFRFIHFDESTFILRNTGTVRTELDAILPGSPELRREPYSWNGECYLTDEPSRSQKAFTVADDGRLIYDYLVDRGTNPEFGPGVFDLTFVPFNEIGEKWGEATRPGPWPAPDWQPVLTSAGEIEAPDIGFVRPRAKG